MVNLADGMPDYKKLYEDAHAHAVEMESELQTAWAIIGQLVERSGGMASFKMSKVFNDVKDNAYELALERDDIYDSMKITAKRRASEEET